MGFTPEAVKDMYTSGEVLADQNGAGAALTFTFATAMDLIWVKADTLDCRADPFGGVPTVALGIPCEAGIPQPLTVRASSVQVFAPIGAVVHVWGYRYG